MSDKLKRYSKGALVTLAKAANNGSVPVVDNMINSNNLSKGFIDELSVTKQQKQQLKSMVNDVEKTNSEISKELINLSNLKAEKSATLITYRGIVTNAFNVITDIIAKGGADAISSSSVAWKQKKEFADEMMLPRPFELHSIAPSNKFRAGSSYTTLKGDYDSAKKNLIDIEAKATDLTNKIKSTENKIESLNKKVTDIQQKIRDGVT